MKNIYIYGTASWFLVVAGLAAGAHAFDFATLSLCAGIAGIIAANEPQ